MARRPTRSMRHVVALGPRVALAVVGLVAIVGVVLLQGEAGPLTNDCGAGRGSPAARYAANAGMPCTWTATVIGEVHGHTAPGGEADGTVIGDAHSARQVEVVILGDPVTAGGTQWVHVYVPTYGTGAGDRDLFTWLPRSIDGQPQLTESVEAACPPTRDNLSTLGILDPMTRARCLGSSAVTVTGMVSSQGGPVSYDVDPPWLSGANGAPSGFSIRNEPYASRSTCRHEATSRSRPSASSSS
jgi:hypothetical protein